MPHLAWESVNSANCIVFLSRGAFCSRHGVMTTSLRAHLVHAYIRQNFKRKPILEMGPAALRRMVERMSYLPFVDKARIEPVAATIDNHRVQGEWHWPSRERQKNTAAILYFHGGGYVFGSPATHRSLTLPLAKATTIPVFSVDYALAPEQPFPAGLNDARRAWQWLVDAQNIAPDQIAIGGDSAGAGLALALGLSLRREARPLPGCLFVYSPYTDLTGQSPSMSQNADRDHMFTQQTIRGAPDFYCTPDERSNPLASPIFGDFDGFPETLIFASKTELLRDDATRLHDRLTQAGAASTLVLRDDLVHIWPVFNHLIPEGKTDLNHTADFIRTHLT